MITKAHVKKYKFGLVTLLSCEYVLFFFAWGDSFPTAYIPLNVELLRA